METDKNPAFRPLISFTRKALAERSIWNESLEAVRKQEPVNPYHGMEYEVLRVFSKAKKDFFNRTQDHRNPSRIYLGYYERQALNHIISHCASYLVSDEKITGNRLQWEGMEVFNVDAPSHCDIS